MNIKEIATTLAILGSGSLVMMGCEKDAPATETPGAADAPATPDVGADAGEAKCGEGHTEEGHCGGEGDDAGEGSCSAEGEGSCSAEGGEGSCSAEGGEKA